MKQTIIGITTNQRILSNDKVPCTYTPSGFPNSIIQAGGLPLLLPINSPETAKTYVDMIDKLVLIGGQNVNPAYYGEEKDPKAEDDYSEARDAFEIALVKEAMAQGKPIFAVCRGMQLMNVVLGGTLHQNLPGHWQTEASDALTQTTLIHSNSSISEIYEKQSEINSYHRQGIKDLAPHLKIIATSPDDDVIEAVESTDPNLHFLGVQWHPELLTESDLGHSKKLFDFIVHKL